MKRAIALFLILMCCTGVAQAGKGKGKSAPQPREASSGPSLEETQLFIRDKMEKQGRVKWMWEAKSDKSIFLVEYSIESVSFDNCIMRLVVKKATAVKNKGDQQFKVSNEDEQKYTCDLKDSNPAELKAKTAAFSDADNYLCKEGDCTRWQVVAARCSTNDTRTAWPNTADSRTEYSHHDNARSLWLFNNQESAKRVAKALAHAGKLCGAKAAREDLFK